MKPSSQIFCHSNNNVYFGQNILFKQTGNIKIGDTIAVIKAKPSILDAASILE